MATSVEVLDALGDHTRRTVFELVARHPRSVGELARHVPVSRPAVSQHLRVLKRAGLVHDEPQGRRRIYRLDVEGIGVVRDYFDHFWDQALTAYAAAVEDRREKEDGDGDDGAGS